MAPEIPQTMRAARVIKAGDTHYTLTTLPVPKPTGTQVLLKTGAAGLCHTDTMVMDGSFGGVYPITGSHEPCGTIVALGNEVRKGKEGKEGRALREDGMDLDIGDRVVALLPVDICHKCTDCTTLDWKYCPNSKYTGINADGAFADYCLVEAETCVRIPDDLSFEQAAPLTCAGVTIYTAIKKANMKPGQVLAISGLGALGHLGVQIAKAMGITVVGIDTRSEPIEMTRKLALTADLLVDGGKTSAEESRKEIEKLKPNGYVGWEGADAVILTADALSAQKYAMDILRRHGLFVIVAQPPKLEFEFSNFIFKDVTVVGSLHGNEKDLKELVDLVSQYGIRSDVTGYPMEEHVAMVDSVHQEGRKGKSVMTF